jgi:hypothetical protein
MGIFWIFFFLILLCAYVLFGLYLTEGITDFKTTAMTWIIYTCLWVTVGTVFLLAYFWGTLRTKNGPYGVRGISGERGEQGISGSCSVTATQAEAIKQINELIDNLYQAKTGKSILNQETQTFTNNYLSNKISTVAGSKQYKIMYTEASALEKTPQEVINYVKGIWKEWFNLIYTASPSWFEDEFADEDYKWGSANPFTEIKKYDMYYWGLSRSFRPMKAEVCRSTPGYENSKFPIKPKARLKIMQSNDYMWLGGDRKTGGDPDVSWFRANSITIGDDTYYPVGDIPTFGNSNWNSQKSGNTTVGDMSFRANHWTGPDMKSIVVSGDVVNPVNYQSFQWHGGNFAVSSGGMICPEGYESMGDVVGTRRGNPNYWDHGNSTKCVPKDCLIPLDGKTGFGAWYSRGISHKVINNYVMDKNANPDNGYNLMRHNNNKPFYRINPKCLEPPAAPSTKDPEDENISLGVGWYGHPYKSNPRYSIFTFLGLVPEGMIVHKSTGRRFYIIHYGGEDINKYIVIDYNAERDKFDSALQVSDSRNSAQVNTRDISRKDERQQWQIILKTNKKQLTLKNIINGRYLYLGLEPNTGAPQFSTIPLDNNAYKKEYPFSQVSDTHANDGSTFTFISTFGTQMDIIDKANNPTTNDPATTAVPATTRHLRAPPRQPTTTTQTEPPQ